MKTLIFDIDGTITDSWPIEKAILLFLTEKKFEKEIEKNKTAGISDIYRIFCKISPQRIGKKQFYLLYNRGVKKLIVQKSLPTPKKYPLVDWIVANKTNYRFVYATGGQRPETLYILKKFGLLDFFDLKNSIDKTFYRFSKKSGRPFQKIKIKFPNCLLITDSKNDCLGATLAKVPFVKIKSPQKISGAFIKKLNLFC